MYKNSKEVLFTVSEYSAILMMANVLPLLLIMMSSTQDIYDLHHVLPTGSDNVHASSLCGLPTRAQSRHRSELIDNITQSQEVGI